MATDDVTPMAEDPTPEELFPEYRHDVAKVSPLLRSDRWGGNGVAWQKFERWLRGEGRKNRRAKEEETPIQQDHEDTKGDDQ